ncbi:MAG: hypothetical protein ABI616_06930 [Pseudomonadota bacterium]
MNKALGLLVIAASLSTAAYADCTYPRKPAKLPDGNTATRDEMVAANKLVKQYNADMTVYTDCIKAEYDASAAKLPADATEDTKKQLNSVYARKNDAAVDEVTTVATQFNEQLRVFKAKSAVVK